MQERFVIDIKNARPIFWTGIFYVLPETNLRPTPAESAPRFRRQPWLATPR